ncbi:hypothetical protein GF407_06800 [candidate division KSB1 bacterium]|nr:hypothetical protein [candidate division KSB1 bacterium]
MQLRNSTANKLCAVLTVLLLLLAGCTEEKVSQSLQDSAAEPTFTITLSETGGISGGTSRYVFKSNGRYAVYDTMPGSKDKKISSGTVDSSRLRTLYHQMLKSAQSGKIYRQKGNITTSVYLSTTDTTYTWRWPGAGKNAQVPADLKSWFFDLVELNRSID